ncbi:hypothetical protein B0A55_11931 [Friedmanniomyces simplex]|uniref:DUF3669 domain-containing protein n=1 Tax=Friedmanniomyces simplex TaxID=329884 RepID=A0A4U0W9X7_9PEZI|nr:hypothetical protein B0A55_11931 [Friedmanniomyces simplex]
MAQTTTNTTSDGKYLGIGAGTCGALWNEYQVLTKVTREFGKVAGLCEIDLRVSPAKGYIDVLALERILPLPRGIRDLLVDRYCPEGFREEARQIRANEDCLARVYLGKRRPRRQEEGRRPAKRFSLRNFNLCLDQMEELGIDPVPFATTMAKALAVMHWRLKCDARDIEFVFGSSPVGEGDEAWQVLNPDEIAKLPARSSTLSGAVTSPVHSVGLTAALMSSMGRREGQQAEPTGVGHAFRQPTVSFWMLDFNQVKRIEDTAARAESAADAFFVNDPYFPKPLPDQPSDEHLWTTFKTAYLKTSKLLLALEEFETEELPNWGEGPELFISEVVRKRRERVEKAREAEARLAGQA